MANMIKSLAGIFGPYVAGAFIGQDPADPSTGSGSDGIAPDGTGVWMALVVFFLLDCVACGAAVALPIETRGVVLAESVKKA